MRTKFPLKICLVPCECSLKCLFRISETYRTIKTNQSEDRLWKLRKKPHTSKATSNIKHHNKLIERETLHQTALLIIFSCLLSLSLQQCNKVTIQARTTISYRTTSGKDFRPISARFHSKICFKDPTQPAPETNTSHLLQAQNSSHH